MKKMFLIIAFITAFSVSVSAQDPNSPWICIVHPESVNQVAFQDKVITVTDLGYPRAVWAKRYITQEWRSNNQARQKEALIASIRYSAALFFAENITLDQTFAIRYFPHITDGSVPNVTLSNLLFTYTFSGNAQQKYTAQYWLVNIAQSPVNSPCNNWRNYRR